MNIALFAQSGIFRLIQTFANWCTAGPAIERRRAALAARSSNQVTPSLLAAPSYLTRTGSNFYAQRKPLRVVRVIEAGQNRASAGRIVISGRMADVCAELDRLAASEAAVS